MNTITPEFIKEMLDYNPDTGVFRWRISTNRRIKIGSIAGAKNWNSYLIIPLKGKRYRAHRLAWMYSYGTWPVYDIDHINGNPSDNRLSNLRDVTTAHNIQNQTKPHKRNKCGLLGVSWHTAGKCWRTRICTNGVQILIGYFNTPEEAHQAYLDAKKKYHLSNTL
jgi:hypothetical protein